ncbi:MAG TPA: aminotransferase class V-fold PLP-dependent enzyme [Vicinamibacterales bacterium]|nr:aminotransferase class V-fold PLP-dependent enzyme [Vicinamibacterales bacterium]
MTVTSMSPDEFRLHFPLCGVSTYVNSCSQGALSTEVASAVQGFLNSWDMHGSPWERWIEALEELRSRFARSIGADPDEVAVMPSASVGINAVVSALRFEGARHHIVAGEFEFPTMGQILMTQERRGARVRWVRARGETLPTGAYVQEVDERTLLVPATHVCYRNGYRLDIAELAALCRSRGAYLFLDDYQRTGAGPMDVHALGVDFMVTGCLKYLLGPPGIAFLYVRRDLIDRLEPGITGWFGRANPFAFEVDRVDWAPSARRFEMGTPPIPNIYGANAALELLESIGYDRVQSHVAGLVQQLTERAQAAGYVSLTPEKPERRSSLVVLRSTDAMRLVAKLQERNVIASARGPGLRISFHAYNNSQDVERVLAVLSEEEALLERAAG